MDSAVICEKCGTVFRSRSLSAFLQTKEWGRKTCPICWAAGPFRAASEAEIAAHRECQGSSSKAIVAVEVLFLVMIIVVLAAK